MSTQEAPVMPAYRTAVVDSGGDRNVWAVRIARNPSSIRPLTAPLHTDTPHDVRGALQAWVRGRPPSKWAPSRVSNVEHELERYVAVWTITIDRVDQMGSPLLSDLPRDAYETLLGWLELTP